VILTARSTFLALAVCALVVVPGCGSSKGSAAKSKPRTYAGAVATPAKPAPPLKLRDSLGRPLDLASLRGKVALITFLYTHCPDVCPTIAANLNTTLAKLGPAASKVQVVAVSADPKGDTPKTVAEFLAAHQMTGKMRYLLGSAAALEKVWHAWGIIAKPDPTTKNAVAHSGLVYGIAASGKITTLYPANFKPGQIVNDVPLLAVH
jgi:protein SCO1